MERTQELFEKIESYLARDLSDSEVAAFENDMEFDPALKLEVEKQRELHRVLSDPDTINFRKKLQRIAAEVKEEEALESKSTSSSYWKIAASVIILFGVGTLLWNTINREESLSELYALYYTPYPVEGATRGTAANKSAAIVKNYAQGDYDKVISELSGTIMLSESERLRLYLGTSYLNTAQEDKAIEQFQKISDTSRYYEYANWYRALSYLKKEDPKTAGDILKIVIAYNGVYKDKANQLLQKITK